MALNAAQAEQLISLVADHLPTGMEAHSADQWLLSTAVPSRLGTTDRATFDGLLAAADQASVPALVAASIAVAGIT